MKTRLTALLVALCLVLAAVPAAVAAEEGHSGVSTMDKLTQVQIRRLLADNPLTVTGDAMAKPSSTQAPFAAGQVSSAALTAGLGRFNALRRLAGLPGVTLDADFCDRAQYGAVLLAAGGKLNHKPAQPQGMEDAFYQKALNATSSCNIYMGTGATLPQAVDAFFDDSDTGNLSNVGHRRWMLNPSMSKTGFGFSPSGYTFSDLTYNFACQWAFDRSGGCDYDFIAWPASGNFPSDLFKRHEAWSVTLNPAQYAQPKREELTVTITRDDGVSWTLSGGKDYPLTTDQSYLNVDTVNYGVDNCIIFRPQLDVLTYSGVYTVHISGLRDKAGRAKALAYSVDFFPLVQPQVDVEVESVDLNRRSLELKVGDMARLTATVTPQEAVDAAVTWSVADPEILKVEDGKLTALAPGSTAVLVTAGRLEKTDLCLVTVTARTGDSPQTTFADVPEDSWFGEAVSFATGRGLFEGVGENRFAPEDPMSRAMVMTVLARADGEDTEPRKGETWDIRGTRWAVTNHVSDGLNSEGNVSLEELATMLFRYARQRGTAHTTMVDHLSGMPDGKDVSSWAVDGMNWAVSAGVLQGDENQRLFPQRSATRAQVAIILQRYLLELA